MSQADDLLALAGSLVRADPRRPKQATLRVGVSSAYRALFLLLRDDATRRLVPGKTIEIGDLRRTLSRCFEHRTMVNAARSFAGRGRNGWLDAAGTIPPELVEVCEAFAELYEARHRADYDQMGPPLRRSQSVAWVTLSERAFEAWQSVRSTAAARAFLLALVIRARA